MIIAERIIKRDTLLFFVLLKALQRFAGLKLIVQ